MAGWQQYYFEIGAKKRKIFDLNVGYVQPHGNNTKDSCQIPLVHIKYSYKYHIKRFRLGASTYGMLTLCIHLQCKIIILRMSYYIPRHDTPQFQKYLNRTKFRNDEGIHIDDAANLCIECVKYFAQDIRKKYDKNRKLIQTEPPDFVWQ